MPVPHPDLPVILATLTPREREIVAYVAAGEPNKVIAIDLAISLRTVEAHRALHHGQQALGVQPRDHLVAAETPAVVQQGDGAGFGGGVQGQQGGHRGLPAS